MPPQEVLCPGCRKDLTLNEKERTERKFICPVCKVKFLVEDKENTSEVLVTFTGICSKCNRRRFSLISCSYCGYIMWTPIISCAIMAFGFFFLFNRRDILDFGSVGSLVIPGLLGAIGGLGSIVFLSDLLKTKLKMGYIPSNVEKLEAKGDIRGLMKALRYPKDSEVRKKAAKALGRIRDTQAADALAIAFPDEDEGVRMAVVKALEQIGGMQSTIALVRVLTDENEKLSLEVVKALVKIGEPSVSPLAKMLKMLKEKDRLVCERVISVLGQIGNAQAVELLVEALKDENENVRRAALQALEGIGWQPADLNQLAKMLKNKDRLVRERAVSALGQIGDAQVVELLVETLKDESESVRGAALRALEGIGWQPANLNQRVLYAIAARNWNAVFEEDKTTLESLGWQPIVDLLIALYDQSLRGEGFLKDSYSAKPVQDIGRRLDQLGGFKLIVEVHTLFAQQQPRCARNLEMVWDRIGDWLG